MPELYTYREYFIPDHMMDALKRWILAGIQPGDFLTAVLENNLIEALGRADETNLRNLPAYGAYLYNEAPRQCWGSPERVAAWPQIIKSYNEGGKQNA